MQILSRLYAFLYWSQKRGVLGISLRTWLILLPLALFVAGFWLRWPAPLTVLWLILAILLWLVYLLARRAGFKRFVSNPDMSLDEEFAAPVPEQHVPLRATGVFSVKEHEDYVLEHPAEYWRVPMGQHIFMVQQQPGRFLYQIVEPQHIQAVEPGYLLCGREPQKALALHFLVSWGPEFAHEPSYYHFDEALPDQKAGEERTIYVTFDHDADRFAVWRSLLQNSGA
ncbi:MAG TPA: hypothetical protein VK879_18580 [Candidatus Sulfomarinibacteraceae bacterium]|nr:hypothetical protein [Candidatus Sulfomarinibacteraceae bacterium]